MRFSGLFTDAAYEKLLNALILLFMALAAAAIAAHVYLRMDETAEPETNVAVTHAAAEAPIPIIGITEDGSIVGNDGRAIEKAPMRGWVDEVSIENGTVKVVGWAMDMSAHLPARAILFVVGTKTRNAVTRPKSRPDVAGALGNPNAADSGFLAEFRIDSKRPAKAQIVRAFGVARNGGVGELRYYAGYPFRTE